MLGALFHFHFPDSNKGERACGFFLSMQSIQCKLECSGSLPIPANLSFVIVALNKFVDPLFGLGLHYSSMCRLVADRTSASALVCHYANHV